MLEIARADFGWAVFGDQEWECPVHGLIHWVRSRKNTERLDRERLESGEPTLIETLCRAGRLASFFRRWE